MKRITLALAALVLVASPVFARQKIQYYCTQGGASVAVPGTQGSGNQKFQRSYPSCTVTVYLPGTVTLVTLYADQAGTPKANPFQASSTGYWFAYVDVPDVDVTLSGGGFPSPVTLGNFIGGSAPWPNVMSFGAKCDGVTNDAAALSTASTAMSAAGGDVVIPAGKTCIVDTNTTIASTVRIVHQQGGIISVSAGKALTVGPYQCGYYQCYTGAGTVQFSVLPDYIDPIWFGAKYDNATDDAAAIQAAINSAGTGTAGQVRSGGVVRITGRSAIGSTLILTGRSTTLEGLGSAFIGSITPQGSSIRALAAVGDNPMIEVKDTFFGTQIRRMRIYGNTATPPHSAISFIGTANKSSNTHLVEDVQIGNLTGDTGYEYTDGFPLENGIIVGDNKDGGIDSASDFVTIRRVFINGCHDIGRHPVQVNGAARIDGAAIRQGGLNPQFLTLDHIVAYYADVSYYLTSHVQIKNSYSCCTSVSDIYTPLYTDFNAGGIQGVANADVMVNGFASEIGRRFLYLNGIAGIRIRDGYWQINPDQASPMAASGGGNIGVAPDAGARKVIYAEANYHESIYIGDDFQWVNRADLNPWTISVVSTGPSVASKTLILDGARVSGGTAEPTISANTINGNDQRLVWIRHDPNATSAGGVYETKNFLIGATSSYNAVDADRYDIPNSKLRLGDLTNRWGPMDIITSSHLFTLTTDCVGGGPVTCTWTGAFPAYVIAWGVTARVDAAITGAGGATNWFLGDGATADKWGCAAPGCAFAQNTLLYQSTWNAATTFGYRVGAGTENVVLTSNAGTFTAGTVKVTVTYMKMLPPAW